MSLILLLCCCAGLFSFFQLDVAQIVCKINAHQHKSDGQLTTIRVSAAKFGSHKAGDEVHVDGVLYDIIHITVSGDMVTVSLFKDTDEADVIDEIVSVFQVNEQCAASDKFNHIAKHKLFVPDGKILYTPYEYPVVSACSQRASAMANLKTFTADVTTNIIKPPPKQIS